MSIQSARCAASLAVTLALAACVESASFNFYTLSGPASPSISPRARAPLLIEVMPANVPQQVQRPQLVLTTAPGQVRILEQQRWSQPVADEITQALSQDLTHDLPAVDVYRSAHSDRQAVYRIAVDVQRFESVPGQRATLDAVWSLTLNPRGLAMTCRSSVSEPVAAASATPGPDYAALVAAHRRAIRQLSKQIATAIGQLESLPGDKNTASEQSAAQNAAPACPIAP